MQNRDPAQQLSIVRREPGASGAGSPIKSYEIHTSCA